MDSIEQLCRWAQLKASDRVADEPPGEGEEFNHGCRDCGAVTKKAYSLCAVCQSNRERRNKNKSYARRILDGCGWPEN